MEEIPAYERLQQARSNFTRLCKKSKIDAAFENTWKTGIELALLSETEMCMDLGKMMLEKRIHDFERPTEREVKRFLSMFEASHDNIEKAIPEHPMWDFVQRLLHWIRKYDPNFSSEELQRVWILTHRTAGLARLKDGQFGPAQGHLLWISDGKVMATLVQKWQLEVDESEKDLIALRTLLILLSSGCVETARQFVDEMKFDWKVNNVPAAYQFLYLVLQAAFENNYAFYMHVKGKYQLVTRRDLSFPKLLARIEEVVFGKVTRNENPLSMVMNMFMGSSENGNDGNAANPMLNMFLN